MFQVPDTDSGKNAKTKDIGRINQKFDLIKKTILEIENSHKNSSYPNWKDTTEQFEKIMKMWSENFVPNLAGGFDNMMLLQIQPFLKQDIPVLRGKFEKMQAPGETDPNRPIPLILRNLDSISESINSLIGNQAAPVADNAQPLRKKGIGTLGPRPRTMIARPQRMPATASHGADKTKPAAPGLPLAHPEHGASSTAWLKSDNSEDCSDRSINEILDMATTLQKSSGGSSSSNWNMDAALNTSLSQLISFSDTASPPASPPGSPAASQSEHQDSSTS
jgi:hypothetical protein